MTTDDMQELLAISDRMVEATTTGFHRYLAAQIDWRDRLVCIEGARGTGKSTLMRQRIKEAFGLAGRAVYVSLDDLWFSNHRVKDAVAWFDSHGYTHLFMDEVHQVENWHTLVKNLYDQFPSLNIVYSGSSLLKLGKGKGDLSRRLATYEMKGLSFREFLAFEGVLDIPPVDFGKLLSGHRKIAADIVGKVKILPLFERYLREGYYPFLPITSDKITGFYRIDRIFLILNPVNHDNPVSLSKKHGSYPHVHSCAKRGRRATRSQ